MSSLDSSLGRWQPYASQAHPSSTYDLAHSQFSMGKIHEAEIVVDAVVRIIDRKALSNKSGVSRFRQLNNSYGVHEIKSFDYAENIIMYLLSELEPIP